MKVWISKAEFENAKTEEQIVTEIFFLRVQYLGVLVCLTVQGVTRRSVLTEPCSLCLLDVKGGPHWHPSAEPLPPAHLITPRERSF